MSTNPGVRRRECFDEVATLYDMGRPAYPDALVQDLIESTNVGPGSRVLEIGCGTGQLTVALARRGVSLVAVELGANLAEIARRKLSGFEGVTVCVGDFDTWPLPEEPFDLVVSATAFHWLDPATRVQKCADALRPGGMLAIVHTHWGVATDPDEFWAASQGCYARWEASYQPEFVPPRLSDLPEERDDLSRSTRFEKAHLQRHVVDRRYAAEQYSDLLRTFSNICALSEEDRLGFLSCIRELIDSRFNGYIMRRDVYDLWTARVRISVANGESPIEAIHA